MSKASSVVWPVSRTIF